MSGKSTVCYSSTDTDLHPWIADYVDNGQRFVIDWLNLKSQIKSTKLHLYNFDLTFICCSEQNVEIMWFKCSN